MQLLAALAPLANLKRLDLTDILLEPLTLPPDGLQSTTILPWKRSVTLHKQNPFSSLTASSVLESLTLAYRSPGEGDDPVQPLPQGAVAALFPPDRKLTALTGEGGILCKGGVQRRMVRCGGVLCHVPCAELSNVNWVQLSVRGKGSPCFRGTGKFWQHSAARGCAKVRAVSSLVSCSSLSACLCFSTTHPPAQNLCWMVWTLSLWLSWQMMKR